jgi:hypothetical protein
MTSHKKTDSEFDQARTEIEGADRKPSGNPDKNMPAAGPHVKKGSTNRDATPGAGALPSTRPTKDVDAGTG